MKIRITTNSELELEDVKAVFRTTSGAYQIVMKNGTGKTIRRVMLTAEGLQALDEIAASSTWERMV